MLGFTDTNGAHGDSSLDQDADTMRRVSRSTASKHVAPAWVHNNM